MKAIRGLFFDVGGTVFDWKNTARENIEKLAKQHGEAIDSEAFAVDWRNQMFKVHTQVRQGNLPWMNSDDMHLRALEKMKAEHPLLTHVDPVSLITSTWHRLKPFNGAPEAIDRLRTGYTVVVLTILSWESIVNSAKTAGVQWDGILSCEFLGYYKPSLQAYIKATGLLGLKPEESMMVAAHEGDLAAARQAGMHTAYVKVPEKDNMTEGFGEPEKVDFDIEAPDFETLCQKLQV
ncbi:2-haloacid dehalogenase [Desulfosalsimonas propionicica]|uniref:2-haloacid dehalogenase n=1 Tax=Desulfosalsimonas propionicica TaxID=332175 RepID=A0A7W0HM77_9BACT|nr:haloacid dehalogenase type II [Desulfosalsimonas propionicica]MBA2882771.1 2-haloacid dehalogenase [Desulfosalsimonas propionicica]